METVMKRALAVSVATALFLIASMRLGAQAPAFEVASIKPSPPGDPSNPLSMIPVAMPQPGGRFKATNFPLWAIISTAWELPDFRIIGGDKALMNVKYDITAKAEGTATLGFQLKPHLEPRQMAFYDLVLARSNGRLGPQVEALEVGLQKRLRSEMRSAPRPSPIVGDDRVKRTTRSEARVDPRSSECFDHRQRAGADAGLSSTHAGD